MKKRAILLITLMVVSAGFLSGCTDNNDTNNNGDNNIQNQSPSITASATPYSGALPLEVNFICVGSDTDGSIVTYSWDFDDGETSSQQNPTHTFQSIGTYYVTITITDNDGATNSDTITITVNEAEKVTEATILTHVAYLQTMKNNPQNDGIKVYGILQNTGETNIRAEVTINFYNEHDYLVYSDEGHGKPIYIAPNQKTFFDSFVSGELDYSYYTVEFSGGEHYRLDYTDYTVSTETPYTYYQESTDDLLYKMNGTIYNSGSSKAEYVNIYVVYYDTYGNILGCGIAFIGEQGDNDFFPPQTSKTFQTVTYPRYMVDEDYSKIASSEFFVSTPHGDYRNT